MLTNLLFIWEFVLAKRALLGQLVGFVAVSEALWLVLEQSFGCVALNSTNVAIGFWMGLHVRL